MGYFQAVNSIEEEEGPQQVHEGEHLADDELHRGTSDNNQNDHRLGDDATKLMLLGMTSRSS